MSSDAQIVQFASAGMILCGLLCTVGASTLFPLKTQISKVTAANPISWSPRSFGGLEPAGKSPIFGMMWSVIYGGELLFAIFLLVAAAQRNVSGDAHERIVFNHASCVFSGLLLSCLWPALFSEQTKLFFILSSILLVISSVVLLIGAIISKPFAAGNWWLNFGGVVTSFFAGWVSVATAINIGIVTRVYNHGVNTRSNSNETSKSLFPLVLSVALAIVSIIFANPILSVPLLIATFFMKGIFSDWRIFCSTIVCVLAIVAAGLILTL